MFLTVYLASIMLAFQLTAERTRISLVAKSYLRSILFTGGVNNISIVYEPYGLVMIIPGIRNMPQMLPGKQSYDLRKT